LTSSFSIEEESLRGCIKTREEELDRIDTAGISTAVETTEGRSDGRISVLVRQLLVLLEQPSLSELRPPAPKMIPVARLDYPDS